MLICRSVYRVGGGAPRPSLAQRSRHPANRARGTVMPMPNPEARPAHGDPVIDATVKAALDDLLGDNAPEAAGEVPDLRWLGLGIRLGLERPDRARHLLDLLEAGDTAPVNVADPDEVPVRSQLLARSALTAPAAKGQVDAEVVFGWASRLAPSEILAIGRTVEQMVADGASTDVTRGFGIAWRAGAKIPLKSLDGMLAEFTQLQLVVAGVLAGHDIAAAAREEPKSRGGFGALSVLQGRLRGSSPAMHESDMVLRQRGRPAALGLVALWNAWTAVRYRDVIPAATFDLLVQPWISVVGRLP